MNEERMLAELKNEESPIWDTIEQTHHCYNSNMQHCLEQAQPNDVIFIASHNIETVEMAKKIIEKKGIKDSRVRFG